MFKRRVFVSYATEDHDKAGFLASRLGGEGFDVFFAPRTIQPGEPFENAIDRELMRCHVFIVLISKSAIESEWVNREIDVALNRHNTGRLRFFIPIVVEMGVEPPERIRKIQHYRATTHDLEAWEGIAIRISNQIRTREFLLFSLGLLTLTLATLPLESWVRERLHYMPFVLLLEGLTVGFVWFKLQTRSKWLSLILFVPVLLQFVFIGYDVGTLRRNESEQAKTSAFALCNAANEYAFNELWDRLANTRSQPSFVEGLRAVSENDKLSLISRINAQVALARLGQFDAVRARLNPGANTTLFEFARKHERWLRDAPQIDWVLTWLDDKDPRVVIWGIRTLGLAHELIQQFPPSVVDRVRERLLVSFAATNNAGVLNNARWALLKLGSDSHRILQAERGRPATGADHLGTREVVDLGITLVQISPPDPLPGQQPFYLSDAEITVEQFGRFVQDTPGFKSSAEVQGTSSCFGHDGAWYGCSASWRNPGLPERMPPTRDLPVVQVSWVDAVQFCNWLSQKEGLEPCYQRALSGIWNLIEGRNGYRLPRVSEWEIGSRAGTSTLFWWGDFAEWQSDRDWKCLMSNLPDSSFSTKWKRINTIAGNDGYQFHAPVRTFAPNDWGLFDTVGNVGEWCEEETGRGLTSCQEYATGKKPRLGGSWGDDLQFVDVTSCRAEGADTSHVNVGFRIARTLH